MSIDSKYKELYRQLTELPENKVGEIIGGELIVSPRPGGPHAIAASSLGIEIGAPYQKARGGPGGWWIIDEPEIHLSDDVVVPDVAGWRKERMPQYPEDHRFTVPPDWVCEVFSPSSHRLDRAKKLPLYAREGIAYVWLVDPRAKTLEAYLLEKGKWTLHGAYGEGDEAHMPPFEGISINIASLWT
jgi:Uma2 family endonuclease